LFPEIPKDHEGTTMKKQINPSIEAHLLRSALILLSLLAICVIPFALAQSRSRETTKRSVASRTDQSQLPTKTIGPLGVPAFQMLPVPKLPAVVLYDQLNNPGAFGVSSQEFPDFPAFTDFAADDFVVPSGQTWTITEVDAEGVYLGSGPADNFNVFFYQNNGSLPGIQVYSATAQSYVNSAGVFQVTLTVPAVLTAGTYWVSVQAHMSLTSNGQWGWIERTVQANSPAAWQNPGGGLSPPSSCPAPGCPMPCPNCITWGIRQCCTGSPAGEPDQMFRLIGTTTGGGTPTPTATGTPSPSATGTPSPTPTATPSSTASSTPGSCTSYEAESATLEGSAVVLNCPTCSGGQKVGYVGSNSGTLQFTVSAIAPGNHSMTICYLNGDAVRYALLSVNGSQGTPLTFPSTGSFQTVGSIQTTITLNTGNNTLEFYNPIVGSWAPDFDRIQFNCPTCAAATLGNISTRSFVQTGDNVMIGGFIVRGAGTKRVILRAIGPELSQYGVPNAMANPTLELHNGNGVLLASNDDWMSSNQVQEIQNTRHAPGDPSESAIVANLSPGNYTAIVRGVNDTMGVALVEVYDLNLFSGSFLGNISTRSFVQTADDVMIGGFIVEGTQATSVIIRAIGPELSQYGVPNPLADPTLELHNGTGALIASNNNWHHTIIGGIITSNQVQDIQNSGHAPGDASESAIIANLPPGNYTAIVRGVNNTTGVALVEVYDLH
jgi:Alpha-galactosidase, CBM13 domain